MALDGDMLGTKSTFQSSQSAACDPGYGMEHPWYRRDTVAESLDRSRTNDEGDLMAAEIQAAAVCQEGERGQSAKDCWYQANSGSEKGEKGKKDKKGQRKSTRTKDDDDKRKGVCNKCDGSGDFASKCLKERESSNASYSGGGDPYCLTYTDDQFHWITRTCGGWK